MSQDLYAFGELVTFTRGEWIGRTGIVSKPIHRDGSGFVIFEIEGWISGCSASFSEVQPASSDASGFTQLAYHLLKLSSLLIERTVVPLVKA